METYCDVSPGHSLFGFIREVWLGDHRNDRAMHRLCNVMRKMGVQTAIVEQVSQPWVSSKKKWRHCESGSILRFRLGSIE